MRTKQLFVAGAIYASPAMVFDQKSGKRKLTANTIHPTSKKQS
ncbi:hypothetical protein U879_01825 [Defluviimonas sp. 20V17]|nr:hypothetical protein U879_01825 [Defluviimonas sp. 20V17]